jgi:hypothetical protein
LRLLRDHILRDDDGASEATASIHSVSWQHRLPHGISNVERTDKGFEASLSLPVDDDGFFGQACPACEQPFKMNAQEWDALPNDARLTCPYCGEEREDPSDFMTADQRERTEAALQALVEQYAHRAVSDMLRSSIGGGARRMGGGMFGIEITVDAGTPPPIRVLPDYVEANVRRTIKCDNCSATYAVYGASAFCPVCGPRGTPATVREAIAGARTALAVEDMLPDEAREEARAAGVFNNVAADTLKRVVTLFEVFVRNEFETRVPAGTEALRRAGPGVFQRLEDADELFAQHVGRRLSTLVDNTAWERLLVAFQQRHVLVHRHGRIDERYLERVPTARQNVGQVLVVTRKDAEQALNDLEHLVQALAAS